MAKERQIKNIAYFFHSSSEDTLAYHRLIGPAQHLGLNVIRGFDDGEINVECVTEGDIVVIQRDFPRFFDDYERIITLTRKEKKPVVFDLDDLLLELPEEHPDRQGIYYADALLPMLQALIEADMVTVSTAPLQEYVSKFNRNVRVLPNFLNDALWTLREPKTYFDHKQSITIGYMGGNSHALDLRMITPIVLELIDRYPSRLKFHFWGIAPPAEIVSLPQVTHSPLQVYDYPKFVAAFQNQTADIFIAPLVENLFNSCKSSIKFLEYSALGNPGVYSHVQPYSSVITNGYDGYLASTSAEWLEYLGELIESPERRIEIASNAQETIRNKWLLSKNAHIWLEAYQETIVTRASKRSYSPFLTTVSSINSQLGELYTRRNKQFQALTTPIAENSEQIQALNAQLKEITTSKAWRLALVFRRIRVFLFPPGGWRHRLVRKLFFGIAYPLKVKRYYRLGENLELIRNSELFDVRWYLENNPDVAQAGMDPSRHYLIYGGFEGRDPCLLFSSREYLEINQDVKNAGINPLVHYLRDGQKEGRAIKPMLEEKQSHEDPGLKPEFKLRGYEHIVILTTSHSYYVAELIENLLKKVGINSKIIFDVPSNGYEEVPHFVLCPQMYSSLPNLYVAFQMEQSVSSRWFDDKYFQILENSFAIFDYSLKNIEFLTQNGLSDRKIFFMPISYCMDYFTGQSDVQGEKEYDVLFYGDINNDRRREFIKIIQGEFNVKLINNIFGESLYQELRKGKVVINIHYYEGALLETTRIFECLSNDCLVISEKSTDYSEYSFLDGIVDFVEIGDVKGMSDRIRYWISNDYERESRIRNNRISLNKKIPNWFEYYLMRFLLATENIVF
ncbi:MAG: glycosyltransferase, partial [Candidatus Bathyarchaeia archaeon]